MQFGVSKGLAKNRAPQSPGVAKVMCKGVVFDFNGVLVLDSAQHEAAWQQFACQLRGHPFTPEEFRLHVHGGTNERILAYLLGRSPTPVERTDLAQRKESIYRDLCRALGSAFTLSPGAHALLDALRARDVPRTIATSADRGNIDYYFAEFGLARWFDFECVVYDNGSLPSKPAPDVYCRAASNLGLSPANCVVIEDAVTGIEAARRAGVRSIAALGPVDQHTALAKVPGVTLTIESLAEFPLTQLLG